MGMSKIVIWYSLLCDRSTFIESYPPVIDGGLNGSARGLHVAMNPATDQKFVLIQPTPDLRLHRHIFVHQSQHYRFDDMQSW